MRAAGHIGIALIAFVIIGAVSVVLIGAIELRGYMETRSSTLGEEAAVILAEGGQKALHDWLQNEAEIPEDVSIYVLDESSKDMLGREFPEDYAEFVYENVIGKPVDYDSNYQPVRLAPHLIAPDGQRFAFLVMPKAVTLWGSKFTLLGLLVVALMVITIVAWLIARTLGSPIRELQLAVRELALGHTNVRIPRTICDRNDELGTLAADFNAMADQLSELIKGREMLMREMSHELRSPLARLQAALALTMEKTSLPSAEYDRLENEIGRMNHVIGEMLRYSSIDTTVKSKQSLVRIDKLLDSLIQDEEVEATSSNCTLQLDTEAGLAVIGDPELLRSCFENILRNAIRYAPAQSVISLTARRLPDTSSSKSAVIVEISDRGPGVASEDLEQIFKPYFRVASGGHHQDSTGLGLAIVRRIAEQHLGTATATQRDGGGLTVVISLPAVELS